MGVAKLADAAKAIVERKGRALSTPPICRAIGNTRAAAAVLVMNSVSRLVII